jgi:uncharacterized protein YkwD
MAITIGRLLWIGWCFCGIAAAQESDLVQEVNRLRADPAKYADLLKTRQASAAVKEAIQTLKRTAPRPELERAEALEAAARDHVRDIGPKGLVQHKGRDGSRPVERIARHGINRTATAEVISFGPSRARDVIVDLVIDEGVKDRGHRKILLDPELRYAGAACGPHKVYRTMCVIDFAGPTRAESRRQ